MKIIKANNGNWYLNRKTSRNTFRNWFFVKNNSIYNNNYNGYICAKTIYLPKEFIGKKIRLKVELI